MDAFTIMWIAGPEAIERAFEKLEVKNGADKRKVGIPSSIPAATGDQKAAASAPNQKSVGA